MKPGGGPLQMLLTPALNLLLAGPKMWPLEQHLGLSEKFEKLIICTGNSASLITFLLKNFAKILLQVFKENKHYLLAL
jgi:hypothetical protein